MRKQILKRIREDEEEEKTNKIKQQKIKHVDPEVIESKAIKDAEEGQREVYEEDLKGKGKKEQQIMPMPYDLAEMYKKTENSGAAKDDAKYYRDGVFHSDEQKEKTVELIEKRKKAAKYRGLEEEFDEDPGYFPPVNYDHDGMEVIDPCYTIQTEKTGKEFFVFPLVWSQIGLDWTIVVLGKRRSGKTCFIKSLCGSYLRPFFPRVYVFTKTKCSGEYSAFIPEKYIIEGLNEEKLAEIFKIQKKYKEYQKEGKFHGNMNVLIIIDDCLSDNLKYQKLINEVFFEGRHVNICFIVTSQDCKGINPACTGNADMAIVFNVRSERDKDAIRTKFCDFFRNNEEMENLTAQVTHKKWHVICFDQSEPSRDPRFTLFCGRAPPSAPFVLGSKVWWKSNQKQLIAITNENPELAWLLDTPDWGIIGEHEMNTVL